MTNQPARRALPSLLAGLLTALPLLGPPSAAAAAPPASAEGVLSSVAVDTAAGGASAVVQHVRVGARLLPVHGQVPQRTGARVRIPTSDVVRAQDVEVLSTPAAATTGTRSVLVVPLYASARDHQTPAAVQQDVQGRVGDYYREVSYGALTLDATTMSWQRAAAPLPCSDFYSMRDLAVQAVTASGRDPEAFDSVVVYASARDCPPDLDRAELGGRYVVLSGQLGNLVHELGHNLGLGHASAVHCTGARSQPVPLSSTCTTQEYGDPYDAMGIQDHHFSAPHKAGLGWLDGRTRTVRGTGTTWLRAYERTGGGLVAVRVETGYRTYWLEARRPVGVDRILPASVTDGALVHLDDHGTTQLLDMNPRAPYAYDHDLSPGRSWTDPERGVRISVGSRTSRGLPVTVTYLRGFAPPVHSVSASAGPDVRITWSGWPDRTPDALEVRRGAPGDGCPASRQEGTLVGGTAWRTSQADRIAEGELPCYSLFARYAERWSSPAFAFPGCSTPARPSEVTTLC